MTKTEYIGIKHSIPDLKGRIMDIPGGGITTFDPQGNVLAKNFSLKITSSQMIQPDKAKAPHGVVTVQVTKATPEGGRTAYSVTVPTLRLLENFFDVLRDAVGPDADFDDRESYDKLLLVTLAASKPDTQQLAPTFKTQHWTEASGIMFEGKLVCSAPIEVSREISTETGEKLFRLRIERQNQPGFHDYTTCTREEVLNGNYHFPDRIISSPSAIKAAMAVFDRWCSLSEGDRVNQIREEATQPDREAKEKRNRQFGFHGRP